DAVARIGALGQAVPHQGAYGHADHHADHQPRRVAEKEAQASQDDAAQQGADRGVRDVALFQCAHPALLCARRLRRVRACSRCCRRCRRGQVRPPVGIVTFRSGHGVAQAAQSGTFSPEDSPMRLPLAASTLAIAIALAACSPQPESATASATTQQAESETERLNAWFDEQYEEFLQFSPTALTFQGRKDRYGELDDISEQAMRERLDWMAASVAEMESNFDYDALEPDARVSWEIWKRQYDTARGQWEYRQHGYSFDQMNGMNSVLPMFLINFHKVEDEQDYLAYVSRLQAAEGMFDQLLEYARASAEQGIRPPRFAYAGVIEQ